MNTMPAPRGTDRSAGFVDGSCSARLLWWFIA